MHEHLLRVANRVEDVALGEEVDRLRGCVRRVAELGHIGRRDLHEVSLPEHALGLGPVGTVVETELRGEAAAQLRLHVARDLEAHDRCELALAQLDLDHLEEVVGSSSSCSVIALRVTRNSAHASISMPGNNRSRLFAITSARSTNVRDVPSRMNRDTPPPVGTLTRASSDSESCS